MCPGEQSLGTNRLEISVLKEHTFTCPYCWEQISMLLDLSAGGQSYVEDCEVCCNPISISFESNDGELTSFSADGPNG
jgi:transcription elongation factor Elf1